MPPSPSAIKLPGFTDVSTGGPITLPSVPVQNTSDESLADLMKSLKTDNEALQELEVEDMLSRSGFTPVDKILTKDENDMLMCQYIKSTDPSGKTVYVDMDCKGYVSVDPENMTMVQASGASSVPYSLKMGAYECADNDVCGVAFECDGEVCTLKRVDNDVVPSEDVFAQVSSGSPLVANDGITKSQPIPYPIVSLTDIKKNPAQVMSSIRESHNRMRNVAFRQADRDAENLLDAVRNLDQEIARFNTNQKDVSAKLSRTISQLEEIHQDYQRDPPSTAETKKAYRSVQYNLRRRNDLVIDHLKLSESVTSRMDRIKELVGEIKSLNDYGEQLFAGVEFVYQE